MKTTCKTPPVEVGNPLGNISYAKTDTYSPPSGLGSLSMPRYQSIAAQTESN
jgi:hypothetical protein